MDEVIDSKYLDNMKIGESITYYTGYLPYAKGQILDLSKELMFRSTSLHIEYRDKCNFVQEIEPSKEFELKQKKIADFEYQYIATRIRIKKIKY